MSLTNSNSKLTISKEKLAEMLEKIRAAKLTKELTPAPAPAPTPALTLTSQVPKSLSSAIQGIGKHGESITYNTEQQEFINLAASLKSAILIGAAGTGKTTCMMGAINALIHSGKIPVFKDVSGHKYLKEGTPGIVACSFTRRAVSNLRKAMPAGMEYNCITIHKLLAYQRVFYEIIDPETGEEKKTMRFEPTRNRFNPLPSTLKTIIIDESSMVSVELFHLLCDALPHPVQWIYLGDIQQLPPVFGSAILGYKMLELPTVELTQVYRQALESPIIAYATDIKDGKGFEVKEKKVVETSRGKVTFIPWKKKIASDVACLTFCKFISDAFDAKLYNPDTDIVLVPFNKAFGSDEINKSIANHAAKARHAVVWEIVAGFNTLYLSVGDKVLFDKEDATGTKIVRNASYYGKKPAQESPTLDYWGHDPVVTTKHSESESEESIDAMLDAMANSIGNTEADDRVRAASHIVTVTMNDSEIELEVDTAAGLNSLILSYALTIHKAQGSEWDKVFLVLHQSHATMCQRELLYTAVTRAAKELYIISEPDTFVKGVASQRIKGNTLAEKALFFQGKLESNGGNY